MHYTRRTLAKAVVFEGLGLHSGEPVRAIVNPASDGIHFRFGNERTHANPSNVSDTVRSTKLGSIGTIEHLMSAFAGMEITDAEIEVSAPEIPGMDGSSLPFVMAMMAAGFADLEEVELPNLFTRVFFVEEAIKVAVGKGDGRWRYNYELGDRWPGSMEFEAVVPKDYVSQVASARTFALAEEIPQIIQAGLAQGLDESSALILGIEGYKNEPRFPDEPARHKLLDLIGDLYLSGVPIRFLNVNGARTGHRTNVMTAQLVLDALASYAVP